MAISVPLKLKDSADFQDFISAEENYLAYQVGSYLITGDSSSVGSLARDSNGSNEIIGYFTDTSYDSAVGTGGDTSFLTFTQVTTPLRTTLGTITPTDSDYRKFVYQYDSDGQKIIQEAKDSDLTVLIDRLNSRIHTSEYLGSYRLGSTAPSGDYTLELNNVMTDTRTDGNTVQYNIYQRTIQTAPTKALPFAVKRSNGDSGDYEGLQLMTDRQIQQSLGLKARNRLGEIGVGDSGESLGISTINIGNYKLLSSAAGTPTDVGFSGTWAARGTATDTRQQIVDANYTRGRVSTYSRLRESNFTDTYTRTRSSAFSDDYSRTRSSAYTANYVTTRTSNFSLGFVGNFIGNFTRTSTRDSQRTRSSVFDYVGNYVGDFTGNYSRLLSYAGNFTGDYVGGGVTTTRVMLAEYGFLTRYNRATSGANNVCSSIDIGLVYASGTQVNVGSFAVVSGDSWNSNIDNGLQARIATYAANSVKTTTLAQNQWLVKFLDNSLNENGTGQYLRIAQSGGGYPSTNLFNSKNSYGARNLNDAYLLSGPSQPTFTDGFYIVIRDDDYGSAFNEALYVTNNQVYDIGRNGVFSQSGSAEIQMIDFDVNTTANYTRTSTRTSLRTATYTRNSTQDFLGNYTRTLNYLGNYTGDFLGEYTTDSQRTTPDDFTRDFLGNYSRNYLRTRTSTYTRNRLTDFIGDFTGNYTGDYLGDFAGNFVGPRTDGVFSNTLQVISHTQYTVPSSGSTSASFNVTVPTGTKSVVIMGSVGTNSSRRTRHTGASIGGVGMPEFVSIDAGTEYTFDSAIYAGNYSSTGTRTVTVTYTNTPQSYGAGVKVLFLNKALNVSTGAVSRSATGTSAIVTTAGVNEYAGGLIVGTATVIDAPASDSIGRLVSGAVSPWPGQTGVAYGGGNRDSFFGWKLPTSTVAITPAARTLQGNYGQTFVVTSFPSTAFVDNTADFTRTSTRNSLRTSTRNSTVTFTGDFIGNYSRDFIGNYSRNFTRTRTSVYLGSDSFSRNFEGNYLGNYSRNFTLTFQGNYSRNFAGEYIGDYSRDFIGDYSRTFTGNYAGDTIGAFNTTIQTYTLYVRVL